MVFDYLIPQIFDLTNYDFLNNYSIPNLIAASMFFLLGIFLFSKKKSNKLVLPLAAFSFCNAWWQFFFFISYNSINPDVSFFLMKLGFAGVIAAVPLFFHLSVVFDELDDKFKRLVLFNHIMSIVWLIVLLVTDNLFKGVSKHFFGYYTTAGNLFILFIAQYEAWLIVSFSFLFHYFITKKDVLSELEKNQITFFYFSLFVLSLTQIDFVLNFGVDIYPFGFVPLIIFTVAIMYLIVRYKFLDIETALHRTFAWFTLSFAIFLPMSFVWFLFKNHITQINFFSLFLLSPFLLFMFVRYYLFLQTKIDKFFRRRYYELEKDVKSMLDEISELVEMDELIFAVNRRVVEIFSASKCAVFLKKGGTFVGKDNNQKESSHEFTQVINHFKKNSKALEIDDVYITNDFEKNRDDVLIWFSKNEFTVLIPLKKKEVIIGFLALDKKDNLHEYSSEELLFLEKICEKCSVFFAASMQYELLFSKK